MEGEARLVEVFRMEDVHLQNRGKFLLDQEVTLQKYR